MDLPDSLLFVPAFAWQAIFKQNNIDIILGFLDKLSACASILFLFERENTGIFKIYNFFTIQRDYLPNVGKTQCEYFHTEH